MKNVEKLNAYLANVAVLIIKLHNLHWNVEGRQFHSIHTYTETMYDEFFEKYDSVAELIKMNGDSPLVRMSDYLKVATVKELEGKAFTPTEVLDTILADLKLMSEDAKAIRSLADEADQFDVVSEMEDHLAYYSKQIWFIKATLKGCDC